MGTVEAQVCAGNEVKQVSGGRLRRSRRSPGDVAINRDVCPSGSSNQTT